jgi:riboflavin synthase alpha subunit
LPTPTIVRVLPETVQILNVDEVKVTARVDVEVAVSVKAESPKDLLVGDVKAIVCVFGLIRKDCDT